MESGLSQSNSFADIVACSPRDRVTFASLFERFEQGSLGVVILFLAIAGMAPGISILAGALLSLCAVQMMLGQEDVLLPRFIAGRSLSARRVMRILDDTRHVLRHIERRRQVVRPLPGFVKRAAGIPILVLSITLFVPIPLSNVVPSAIIGATALACMAEDRLLLCGAFIGGVASLAITAAAISAVIGAGNLIF